MKPSKTSKLRSILRKAEEAGRNPESREQLLQEGIQIGEAESMSGPEFLQMLEEDSDDDGPASLTVVVHLSDTPVSDRDDIIDPLCERLESSEIGEWNGSGQGSFGEDQFFDVNIIVNDLEVAVPFVQAELKNLKVGKKTRIYCSDDSTFSLDSRVYEEG